jgi:hypothetical protein
MSAAAALPVAWLVARAAGLVAFGILTVSTWLGLGMSTRLLGPKHQSRLLGWHRTLAWTGLAMVGLHAGALLLDPVMRFGPAAVLVPFASPFRPAAVAAGVVAGWLMLMLTVSFRMRKWIGQRGWRRLHSPPARTPPASAARSSRSSPAARCSGSSSSASSARVCAVPPPPGRPQHRPPDHP